MDNKDYPKVRRAAIKQGWRCVATKYGEMLLSPDGTYGQAIDRLHRSSDQHALDRIVRDMRRHGFVWKGR